MPPDALAVKVTAVPTVPEVGPVTETVRASGLIVTCLDTVCVLCVGVAESVPVTLIVTVPLTLYVVLKLDPVPVAGVPPGALHVKVTGAVPPVAVAVHVTAIPTVPVAGHVSVTTSIDPTV